MRKEINANHEMGKKKDSEILILRDRVQKGKDKKPKKGNISPDHKRELSSA